MLPHNQILGPPRSTQATPPFGLDFFYFHDDCMPKTEDPEIKSRRQLRNWKLTSLRPR